MAECIFTLLYTVRAKQGLIFKDEIFCLQRPIVSGLGSLTGNIETLGTTNSAPGSTSSTALVFFQGFGCCIDDQLVSGFLRLECAFVHEKKSPYAHPLGRRGWSDRPWSLLFQSTFGAVLK